MQFAYKLQFESVIGTRYMALFLTCPGLFLPELTHLRDSSRASTSPDQFKYTDDQLAICEAHQWYQAESVGRWGLR